MTFRKMTIKLSLVFLVLFFSVNCFAENQRTYRVCSQNLYRYGEKHSIKSPKGKKQRDFLVSRISEANCSVVAFQELVGKNKYQAEQTLVSLSEELKKATNKDYQLFLANSNDRLIRNAFLVTSSDFIIEKVENWSHNILPNLDFRGSPKTHARGPLFLQLKPKSASNKNIIIVTEHFKSKTRAWKDPTNTQFEFLRAAAAADIKNQLLELKSNNAIEIFLGDRNSGPSSASAQVLSGRLHFDDFKRGGACRITEFGSPLCHKEVNRRPDFIPIIETLGSKLRKEIYTYKARKPTIIDEVYVFEEDLGYVKNDFDQILAGVIGETYKGSDHLLVWLDVRL